ncbi:MAG: hypothetical protein IT249_08495 [Chitinophagaceae bacterium]|nr:hypothetical protein [Chitinophagaceae bacterium]
MKKVIFFIAALVFLTSLSISAHAQEDNIIRISPCDNSSIQKQADSVKHLLAGGGFSVLREASITMESEYEIPIIVPMSEGTWYQFVFIGDARSNTYEVRMFDYSEKQVVYQKKRWGDVDGNVISYSYIPKVSEYHMIKPLQVNSMQKKNLCGYVMLFKKTVGEAKAAK